MLKWNGWGYKDSGFVVNDKGIIEFSGKGRCVDCPCFAHGAYKFSHSYYSMEGKANFIRASTRQATL